MIPVEGSSASPNTPLKVVAPMWKLPTMVPAVSSTSASTAPFTPDSNRCPLLENAKVARAGGWRW